MAVIQNNGNMHTDLKQCNVKVKFFKVWISKRIVFLFWTGTGWGKKK